MNNPIFYDETEDACIFETFIGPSILRTAIPKPESKEEYLLMYDTEVRMNKDVRQVKITEHRPKLNIIYNE